MRSRKWTDILNVVVNIGVLGALAYILLRPGGVVSAELQERRDNAELRRVIRESWQELVSIGGRLNYEAGRPLIVEFSDYECPYCRQAHERLSFMLDSVGAGLVYLHYPLSRIHPAAEGAARASICAERQGRFRDMHQHLFESDSWQHDPDWIREALAAGIPDIAKFETCLKSETTSFRLTRDQALAERFGVSGTPTFISLNGRHSGIPNADELAEILE